MINFYNIDCNDFMKDKPDNYYDLAIIDPPYIMKKNVFQMKSKHLMKNGLTSMRLDGTGEKLKFNLGEALNQDYFNQLFRISKNQIIFGMQYYTQYLPSHQCVIVWDKMNYNNKFSDAEILWTSFDLGTRIIKQYIEPNNRINPTQKPINLYRKILLKFAKQEFNIIDTHGGSMTIAIACDMEGYNLDICEKNKEYFNKGLKAYKIYRKQLKMF